MKNAKYPKNLDILLDSIHKSYRDSRSKKSSQEMKFQLRYEHFSRGTVFFGTPCMCPLRYSKWDSKELFRPALIVHTIRLSVQNKSDHQNPSECIMLNMFMLHRATVTVSPAKDDDPQAHNTMRCVMRCELVDLLDVGYYNIKGQNNRC